MAPYDEGYRDGVVLTNQRIVGNKIYTLSLLLIRSFLINMSAFLWASNRMNMNYGANVNLSKNEKKENNFRVGIQLRETATILSWAFILGTKSGTTNNMVH